MENNAKSVPTSPDHLKSLTLPMKLDVKNMEWDELDELLQVLFLIFIFISLNRYKLEKYDCRWNEKLRMVINYIRRCLRIFRQ